MAATITAITMTLSADELANDAAGKLPTEVHAAGNKRPEGLRSS
jgi:hypothetical protein